MTRFPPKRIVVAVDLSPASLSALNAATALARRWGSSLEVVRVEEPQLIAAAPGPTSMPALWSAPDAEFERRAERRIGMAVAGFPPERVIVRTVYGWPVRAMLEREAAETDFIVIGTHGRAGLERALLGSLAEAVVRGSRVPVLAVHESKAR